MHFSPFYFLFDSQNSIFTEIGNLPTSRYTYVIVYRLRHRLSFVYRLADELPSNGSPGYKHKARNKIVGWEPIDDQLAAKKKRAGSSVLSCQHVYWLPATFSASSSSSGNRPLEIRNMLLLLYKVVRQFT